jgi:hypothetical protein
MRLSFTIAAGPRQRIHSRARVPWDSRPYSTVSDSRLPFLSPPTIRRATVEVFDPASTRERPTPTSQSVRVTLRLAVYGESVRLGAESLETQGQNFFSRMNTCGHSSYITYSLTRGWVCHLQLLLALASSFILGPESRGTRDHILLSQIRDFPFCRLLRFAGLRWRYSTPPPHGKTVERIMRILGKASFSKIVFPIVATFLRGKGFIGRRMETADLLLLPVFVAARMFTAVPLVL